jgi:hypothetical protein
VFNGFLILIEPAGISHCSRSVGRAGTILEKSQQLLREAIHLVHVARLWWAFRYGDFTDVETCVFQLNVLLFKDYLQHLMP